MPHRHFFAVAGLTSALGLLTLVPDSSDAHSGRIIIDLGTGEPSSLTTLHEDDSLTPADELASVLNQTEFDAYSGRIIRDEAVPEAVTEPEPEDTRLVLEVQSGDNLSLLFKRAGLNDRHIYEISNGNEADKRILTHLYPGYRLAFDIREDGLQSLEIIISELESYVFERADGEQYAVIHDLRQPELVQSYKEAVITDSLFLAAQRGGIPAAMTMEMADIFGGVIDFMLDTREGDTFSILYEEKYLDGKFVGNGSILAATFTNQGEVFTALRYTDASGKTDFFNPAGESMRKAFLKNPVDFVRISSDFNPNRRHPILNTIRAHKGTDYAAPTGTPVVATGDGKITWASRNGSFGNLVVISHSGRFETKYAHLSKFARGIKVGSRVKQGQIIGYVGSTGSATGPHLHFEFLMDGVHRNWRTIQDKLPQAESIPGEQLARFREQTQVLASRMDTLSGTQLALLDNSSNQ